MMIPLSTLPWYEKGSGTPVIFLHGLPLDHRIWNKEIEYFSDFSKACSLDLPGFGNSKRPDRFEMTMASCSELLKNTVISHVDGPVILVAHSMGGYIALDFIRRYPNLIRGVVFVSTHAKADSSVKRVERFFYAKKIFEGKTKTFLQLQVKSCCKDGAPYTNWVKDIMRDNIRKPLSSVLKMIASRPSVESFLPLIKQPTLVIVGEVDSGMKESSIALAGLLPNSTYREIARAGHMLFLDEPKEFRLSIRKWLEEI